MKTLLIASRTALCAGLAAAALAQPAAATSLALAKSFEGNINFAGTQASLQSKAGGAKVCDLDASAQAKIALPKDASVLSATLYWAGTGAIDTEVNMNGTAVSAPAERRYISSIDGFSYFAAAADVTGQAQGTTSFTFTGLKVDTSDTYCSKKQKENSMVAGFALMVVYAHKDERYRTVNVYEGLHAIKNSSVTVKMPDYTPPSSNVGVGRFGYIVWEGDRTGNQKGDEVRFAGELLRDEPFIQKQNAFNSKSGANSDETSLGIDFDIVDLPAPPARALDANAVFTTATDRVLLGAAIMALPSRPADLAIVKSQAGEFKPGNEITYTLEVTNNGGRADSKVVVKDTLPAALAYLSASGADWTCTHASQLVTCRYGKALAPGARASVQLKARIIGEGRIRNSATVSGSGDGVPGNDTSTVEGDAGTSQPVTNSPFVFTVGTCAPGVKIGAAGGTGCALFTGPLRIDAGSTPTIYLTHAENGVAKAPSTLAQTSKTLRFSLECNNPSSSAGTGASYAGMALGSCLAQGSAVKTDTGAQVALTFAKGVASVATTFHYPDVGIVTLRMHDAATTTGQAVFVSVPTKLQAGYRRPDGVANPGSASLAEGGFAEAGEPFQAVVAAFGHEGVGPLANFGNESGEFALGDRLKVLTQEDVEQKLLVPQDDWTGGSKAAKRSFVWNEAGMASLRVELKGYLGTTLALNLDAVPVGRFYPHHFKTETEKGFPCLTRMKCPAEAPQAIDRAVFSKQGFDAIVRAYGRQGQLLQRFASPSPLVPQIALSAFSAPGHAGKPVDKLVGKLVNGEGALATEREIEFELALPWDAAAGTRSWTPPTAVYLRAAAQELRKTAGGAVPYQISSLRPEDIASAEGGIMVVHGRLMVANVIGTPLAKTTVPLRAQYWSGLAWEHNGGMENDGALIGKVAFRACRRSLRLNASSGDVCNLKLVKLSGTETGADNLVPVVLTGGRSSLVLAPVGNASGIVDLAVDGLDYLPSTVGRVSLGQSASPVIYVREMY